MRLDIACIIALVLICIFIQSTALSQTAASQCQIIVNKGTAAGAYVEVLNGSENRVFWGPTNSKGTCYPDLVKGELYTVIVKWNGRNSRTDIKGNDTIYVSV
jgi:hypothetical protein